VSFSPPHRQSAGPLHEPRRIFVGGTGRCGTTILARILGAHSSIHTIGTESRFIVDPKGLLNLVDAFSSDYSPAQAHTALTSFVEFLLHDLMCSRDPPYARKDLSAVIGRNHYESTIDCFVARLHIGDYPVESELWVEPAVVTRCRNLGRALAGLRRISKRGLLRNPQIVPLLGRRPYRSVACVSTTRGSSRARRSSGSRRTWWTTSFHTQ